MECSLFNLTRFITQSKMLILNGFHDGAYSCKHYDNPNLFKECGVIVLCKCMHVLCDKSVSKVNDLSRTRLDLNSVKKIFLSFVVASLAHGLSKRGVHFLTTLFE